MNMMNKDNLIIIICAIIIVLLCKMCKQNKLEHMSSSNTEACDILASMYNNEKVTTTNLQVTENINFLTKGCY